MKASPSLKITGVAEPLAAQPGAQGLGPETALPAALRLRALLFGLIIALLALLLSVALALLIVTGPFHTSIGHIA